MKSVCIIWFVLALFVVPCCINPEHLGAVVLMVANITSAAVVNKRVNPEIFV